MSDRQSIEQAIAALESQRAILGDAVVDASLVALRKQLVELATSQSTEQRKLVSVLFADLVGFTALADKLDPEDVRAIQQAYFAAVSAPIKERGGWVMKYIGDAVMAVFGLPQTAENDPDQAVLAALGMHTALERLNSHLEDDIGIGLHHPLQMRIGVNTGLAVVSCKSGEEYDVTGDSVNLASRLQNAAPTSGVLISQDTYRHVRGAFDLQSLAPISVKGKEEPIQVYLVIAAKKRSFRTRKRGVEGIETQMVGREMELQALEAAFSSAVEDQDRSMITIVADPGMGKSRLLYEFENWVDLRPEQIILFRGRSRMETQRLPYGLLRDLFAFRFVIQDDDPLPMVWDKFETGLLEFGDGQPKPSSESQQLGLDQASRNLQLRAHFVGQLLGYDFNASPHLQAAKDDPAQIQERGSTYLVDYFSNAAQLRPVLILLEDLHWADDASLNLIDRMAISLADRPVLILSTTRPGLFERRPHWMEGQEFHLRLDLRPLSRRDSRRLVEDVLQKVQQIPETLRDLVVTNAEGNPFYVEELVKMLIEEGVICKGEESWQVLPERLKEIRVPETLTGVLQARLDSLPLTERSLIQQASVVGRVFWDRTLSYLIQAETLQLDGEAIQTGLADLREKEMVYRRENSTFAGAQEYIFKHAMLREVTYASVLKRARRAYHRLAAEWMVEATQSGGRVDEYTSLIAEHYFLAGELAIAADWLTRAGERALLQGALDEAGAFFDRSLSLLPVEEGERRWQALKGRGGVLSVLGQDEALQINIGELLALALALNNDSHLAEAHFRRGNYHSAHGEDHNAVLAYQAALIPARLAADRVIEAKTLAIMSISQVRLGEHQAAQATAEAAVAAALPAGDPKALAQVYNNAAVTYTEIGDLFKAVHYLTLALEYYEQVGDILGMGNALGNLGYNYIQLGRIEQSLSTLERSVKIDLEVGSRRESAYAGLNLGLARIRAQQSAAALPTLQQATAELTKLGDEFGQAAGFTYQGLAHEAASELQEAISCFRHAMDIHKRIGVVAYAVDAQAGLARCAKARGELEEAQQQGGQVWRYLNEHGSAGMEFPAWAYLTCAQVFHASGELERYTEALATGYRRLIERAEKISDPQWRKSFLENAPEHRQLLSLWEAGDRQA